MSLPTNSGLTGTQASGSLNSPNNAIVLNIYGNNHCENEDKSTELNETETDLNLMKINNNKIPKNSVMQRPNNILFYDNVRDKGYPLSDNFRNQLSSKDKYLKPINNINNNVINEVAIHQNNIHKNYNINQQNIENAPPMLNNIKDANNNVISNDLNHKYTEERESKCKIFCKKTLKAIAIIICVIILIPFFLFFKNGKFW